MTVQLATGNTDRAVTSASDRRLYAAMQGTECYVHQIGKMCAASLDGPNKLVVENGSLSINGAHVDLLGNTEFTIPSGLQGKKRATICGIYYKAEADGSEDAIEKTYTGDPVESGEVPDPEYPDGNILDNGTTETFMPLYRVVTDGINVLEPVPMYKVLASAAEMQKRWDSLSQRPVLWEGTLQAGQSVTVPNLSKYTLFLFVDSKSDTAIGYKHAGFVYGSSFWLGDDSINQTVITGSHEGDVLTLTRCYSTYHFFGGNHNPRGSRTITKVIGII